MIMSDNKEHTCVERDELLEKTKVNIQKFGLQVIMVSSNGYTPAFSYSIGLNQSYGHPEVICFGLPNDLANVIFNEVTEIIKH